MKSLYIAILTASLFLSGCVKLSDRELEVRPDVVITPSETADLVTALAQQFPQRDFSTIWSSELFCGWAFAKEGDFFRAITCFRKVLMYLDCDKAAPQNASTRIEAITGVIASYVFQKKYDHAIESWDSLSSGLLLQGRREAKWLLLMMTQALSSRKEHEARALSLAAMLPVDDPDRLPLLCYLAIRSQNPLIPMENGTGPLTEGTNALFSQWKGQQKNPSLALGMNLLIPGSGYAYLGQWSTAFTSLTINTLFIGACFEFFKAHQPMAALVTLGLEFGWWAGGAAGARLSAYQYNHRLWLEMARKYMREQKLYPEAILWRALTAKE